MNKETKLKNLKKILEVVEGIITQGVNENMDGQLYAHELVYHTVRTIIEAGTLEVANSMANALKIIPNKK